MRFDTSEHCSHVQDGPYGFWFLNDDLNLTVINKQLDEFVRQGFAGVILHPRDGLTIPYLSQEWFTSLSAIIDGCVKRGLRPWFYDENPFPTGTAGGRLLEEHPELAGQTLFFSQKIIHPENGLFHVTIPDASRVLRVFALPVDAKGQWLGPYQDITQHAGKVGGNWFMQGERCQGFGPVICDREVHPFWMSWQTQFTWTVHWQTNTNQPHLILIVSRKPAYDQHHGTGVDWLNPRTIETFIEMTYKSTLQKIGQERFGKFIATFIDEPALPSPFPWSDGLSEEYRRRYQEDLTDLLPHLALNIDVKSRLTRYRYRSLLGELWEKHFIKPMAIWCKKHNLPVSGHVSPEEDPITQNLNAPNMMRLLSSFDWPGCDQIISPFGPAEPYKLLGPKLVSSVAHQRGKPRIMTEALGCTGNDLTIKMMKKILDWLMVTGSTDTVVLHGQYMSLDGFRKWEAPPSIFYQAPYWSCFKQLSGYIAKIGHWLRTTTPVRPIGVLYPVSVFQAYSPIETREASALSLHFGQLIYRLTSAALDYDLIADHDLSGAKVSDKDFRIGNAAYQCLVIPNIAILDDHTLETLDYLKKSDVIILSLTQEINSLLPESKMRCFFDSIDSIESIIAKLCQTWQTEISIPSHQPLYVNTRMNQNKLQRFLWNPNDTAITVNCSQPIILQAGESCILGLHDDETSYSNILSGNHRTDEIAFSPWTLTPHESNTLVLSQWNMNLPNGTSYAIKLPAKSGDLPWNLMGQTVNFWCEVIVDDIFEEPQLWFERSTFGGPFEITLNGILLPQPQNICKYDQHDRMIDLAGKLRSGVNRLEIQVGPIRPNEPAIVDMLKLTGWFKILRHGNSSTSNAADVRPEWFKALYIDDLNLPRIAPTQKIMTISSPQDWTKLGFPHYSGTMTYSSSFEIHNKNNCFLSLSDKQIDAVRVWVNDRSAGILAWSPFRIDITNYIKIGHNTIALEVSNTLINRIEGKPIPSGLTESIHLYNSNNVNKGKRHKFIVADIENFIKK
jgi:hypothetical protein